MALSRGLRQPPDGLFCEHVRLFMTSVQATPHLSVLTSGPPLVGAYLAWGSVGILLVQVYIYHIFFPSDAVGYKSLVYFVFIAECAQTFLLSAEAFENYVYLFGSPKSWTSYPISWLAVPVIGGIISAVVQLMFAWCLWLLSNSRILIGFIVPLALCQSAAAIATGVQLKTIPAIEDQSIVVLSITVWLAGSALVDVVIAVSMTIYLIKAKSGLRRTDALVNRLIRLVVETGTITASFAIVDLVLFLTLPATLVHATVGAMLTKLYSNCLLVGLNNRALVSQGNTLVIDSTQPFSSDGGSTTRLGRRGPKESTVRVDVFQETTSDHNIELQEMQKSFPKGLRRSAFCDESPA
ncbi:unnamed protein product [Somion occarium]|uniref:DUF6534 domain-containing protein n=1 Tax=Somion occarium TaxID=3059160 RepID=A0ABP1DD94_9APHY